MANETERKHMEEAPGDMVLIEAYLGGDQAAFATLYERYKRQLYAYLGRMIPQDPASVDDVFQQTWVRAIRRLPEYRNREVFLAWLMRIAHNLTVDLFRSGTRRGEQSLSDVDPETDMPLTKEDDTPSGRLDRRELGEAIDRAVRELPPELREVFLLRQDGVSFREIAEIQHCSINTSLARMRYALNKLRGSLAGWAHAAEELK